MGVRSLVTSGASSRFPRPALLPGGESGEWCTLSPEFACMVSPDFAQRKRYSVGFLLASH